MDEELNAEFYGIEDGVEEGTELRFPIEILNEDKKNTTKKEINWVPQKAQVRMSQIDYYPALGLIKIHNFFTYKAEDEFGNWYLQERKIILNLNTQECETTSVYYYSGGPYNYQPYRITNKHNAETNPNYKDAFLKRLTTLSRQLNRPKKL